MSRFFVVLLFVIFPIYLYAQIPNPASIDVQSLSDAQISRLVIEMQRRGISENEAIALARSRGASEAQIAQLRERILEHQSSSSSLNTTGSKSTAFGIEQRYSEKPFFLPTAEEERMFGFQFFNSEQLSFEAGINMPVSGSYLVGPGDVFSIQVYGSSQQSYRLDVNRGGFITIPDVGPVAVGGFTMKQAEQRIFDQLALIYRDIIASRPSTFVNIQMESTRSIRVSVVGEVFTPGTYTLPGTATAFSALHLSGGPNIRGTFRDIRVLREGREFATLDVYDYLVNGNGLVDVQLRDGDVIMVPTYRNRVKVTGSFIRTGIFEARENETLQDLVFFAGGFNEHAYRNRIEVNRNTGREMSVRDIFSEDFKSFVLQNGDSIFAGRVLQRFSNRVRIEGAVFRPGTYELTEGLTLSELIERADGVREDAFLQRALILRLNEDLSYQNVSFNVSDVIGKRDDILLKREDIVNISPIAEMRENQVLAVHGEVLRPGSFAYRSGITLGDLIKLAGGFREAASESYIEVTRRLSYEEAAHTGDRLGHLYQFAIPRSLNLSSKDAQFELMPFDHVFVRKAPGFANEARVTVLGEVNYAGQYSLVNKKERLSDVIKRSGGLTPDAYSEGAMLTRKIALTSKERRLREVTLMQHPELLEKDQLGFQVVGVKLERALQRPGSRDDIFMRDGDELVIPRLNQTISVSGEVLNPLSLPFIEKKGVKHYINQSGGFGVRAKRNRAYVVYPNGTAGATSSFLFIRSYPQVTPGSEIIIPEKPEKVPLPATAWIGIGSGLTSLALAIITIVNQF